MAKKPRPTERAAKTRKRGAKAASAHVEGVEARAEAGNLAPSPGIVGAAAQGAVGDLSYLSNSSDVAVQQIAASRRKSNAAVQATQGVVEPPPVAAAATLHPVTVDAGIALAANATMGARGSMRAEASVIPAPVSITPTVYPESPGGAIIVHNYISINIQSEEFRRFNVTLEESISQLPHSNEISGELRDKLISEITAGRTILTGPKPGRDLIELLIVRPLKWLMEKAGSATISTLAGKALEWLLKMM